MSPKYGSAAWRRRRRPIELPNPSNPYATRRTLEELAGPSIRSATVQTFDAATWTATIQVTGSVASYLENVPVAKTLNAELLTAGAKVGAIFFDDSNPTDAAIVTVYGAVPAAYVTSAMIVDGTIATGDIADLAVTTDKIALSAVTDGRIADLNVTTAKLAASAVTTAKIADLNVTTDKLAAQAVTAAKCLANQANGVATFDSGGDMDLPGDIYMDGAVYPSNQILSKFYYDGTYLATNNNFKVYGALLTTGAIYPGDQTARYLSDDGTRPYINSNLKILGNLYPGNQNDRFFSDNGTYLTASTVLVTPGIRAPNDSGITLTDNGGNGITIADGGAISTNNGRITSKTGQENITSGGGTFDIAIGAGEYWLFHATQGSEGDSVSGIACRFQSNGVQVATWEQYNAGWLTAGASGNNLRLTNNRGATRTVTYTMLRIV